MERSFALYISISSTSLNITNPLITIRNLVFVHEHLLGMHHMYQIQPKCLLHIVAKVHFSSYVPSSSWITITQPMLAYSLIELVFFKVKEHSIYVVSQKNHWKNYFDAKLGVGSLLHLIFVWIEPFPYDWLCKHFFWIRNIAWLSPKIEAFWTSHLASHHIFEVIKNWVWFSQFCNLKKQRC